MNKFYVLKNNDEKYWNEDTPKSCYVDNINEATLFTEDDVEDLIYRKDENLVECTICEGNIEKELEVYKRAIKLQQEFAENIIYMLNYCGGCVCDDIPDAEYFLDQARKEIEEEKKDET